ncbi:MAG: hypothetical protein IIY94_04565 [Oscillospiraceae bacterium]|nr:hypothetical protein [Oscillospiraceae bacterium]
MIRKFFQKSCTLAIAATLALSLSVTAFAHDPVAQNPTAQQLVTAADWRGAPVDLVRTGDGQAVEVYRGSLDSPLQPGQASVNSASSSGGSTYYYNTGLSCPSQVSYDKYDLLDVVEKGDVIFEKNGGYGITGHTAIVEGIYPRNDGTGRYYIRLIEALSNKEGGVTRSILDDTRVDDKAVTILRVSGATSTKVNNAVSFCQGELGSRYFLDFAKDHSASETDWYCSELVWAAYYNQGINIEVGGLHGEPGVTPRDILRCSLTYTVPYSRK